ncbi:MAG: hypothetical protein L0209_00410, partial [candidate division Zixibacteria bacterium]|nr:hypothetical protein [candidate division Zixibacteria bacterium]
QMTQMAAMGKNAGFRLDLTSTNSVEPRKGKDFWAGETAGVGDQGDDTVGEFKIGRKSAMKRKIFDHF